MHDFSERLLPRVHDWDALSTRDQWHTVTELARELCRADSPAVQRGMLGRLAAIAPELAARLAASLGLPADVELIPAEAPRGPRTRPRDREVTLRAV